MNEILLGRLKNSPELYVFEPKYRSVSAFITGYDVALEGELLSGFTEWLAEKLGHSHNLTWHTLILKLAFPGDGDVRDKLNEDESNRRAISFLVDQLSEFLESTSRLK